MTPGPHKHTHDAHVGFPPERPLDHAKMQSGLDLLRDWGFGSAATAIVMAALLPFAVAWRVGYLAAITAALIGAVILTIGCHTLRGRRLMALAIFPELSRLPDLAGKRRRLVGTRNRRRLARWLRQTAAPSQPYRRFDCCPALPDRVAAVRPALLTLATALEQSADPDPASVALIHELLAAGRSPLYNPNVPADDLHAILTRAQAGIAA
jgi:hypothetical protein